VFEIEDGPDDEFIFGRSGERPKMTTDAPEGRE
jgi:hypothetical protein